MASTNKTENYGLNQWVGTDPVLMADMNADNAKIDAALKALANSALKMEVGTYVGTGPCAAGPDGKPVAPPPKLTLDFKPVFALVTGPGVNGAYWGYFFRPQTTGRVQYLFSDTCSVKTLIVEWGDDSVSWYHNSSGVDTKGAYSLNYEGNIYNYLVIGE